MRGFKRIFRRVLQQPGREALVEAEGFLSANPGSVEARYLVGRTALGAGQFDKAIGAFDDVLAKQSRHCNAMANLGKAYVAKKDWTQAASALERATQCDPQMGLAWESLGFVRQKMASGSKDFAVQQRNYEQAIAAYRKAQAIKPSGSLSKAIADCEHNLSVSLENQGIAKAEAEPVGSMGDDTPMAVLSQKVRSPFDYFRQQFAQVTNPPIDSLRERIVMSLQTNVGGESNLFEIGPQHAEQVIIN